MLFEDEKDYIMRMIKEMVRVLFSIILGKEYTQVELPKENKYGVSGTDQEKWKEMIDAGEINEAENMLLEKIDYQNKNEIAAAVLFYEYVGEKGSEFLEKYNYSMEEVYEGLRQLAVQSGYGDFLDMFEK